MRWIRRKTDAAGAAVVLALVAALVACSSPLPAPIRGAHPGDETPRHGGTLRLASFGDMKALDPAVAGDALSGAAITAIFAGLIDYDAQAHIVPDLAERYEVCRGRARLPVFPRPGRPLPRRDGAHGGRRQAIHRARAPPQHAQPGRELLRLHRRIRRLHREEGGPPRTGSSSRASYVVAIHLKEHDAAFLAARWPCTRSGPSCKSAGDRYSDTWSAVRRRSVQARAGRMGARPEPHARAARGLLPPGLDPTWTGHLAPERQPGVGDLQVRATASSTPSATSATAT